MVGLLVVGVVAAAFVALAYSVSYNRLVRDRQSVADAWAVVDSELQRRHELIPPLVEAVRGAAAHERTLLDDLVAKGRNAARTAGSAADRSSPEQELAAAAAAVVALRERYPALNTQQNFLTLQRELAMTEDRISAARRYHNIRVAEYNRRTEAFPSQVVAARHGFTRGDYFAADDAG